MEINQIMYVIKVAQYQNFSRAAEELFITQPTLSQQISKLEEELGLVLFERTTRSVKLTSVGEEFVKHAVKVVKAWEDLELAMKKHHDLEKGRIVVGILPTLSQLGLTHHIVSFLEKHQGINIEFEEAWSEELISLLQSNKVDIAFLNPIYFKENNKTTSIDHYPLMDDSVVLIVNKNHPFAKRPFVLLEELGHMPMIMLTGHCSIRKTIDSVFEKHNISPLIVCECSSVETLIGLIGEGMGISCLSSRVASNYKNTDIKIIPIQPHIKTFTVMALSQSEKHSPATIALKNFILNNFSKQ